MIRKLRVGWFSFTCCEDSTIMFTELLNRHWQEWLPRIEFIHAKVLQSKNEYAPMDVAFVEGALANPAQEERVKKIRSLAAKVVAIGACACTGLPSAQRNTFDDSTKTEIKRFLERSNQSQTVRPLKDVISVDYSVPGCPMIEEQFVNLLNGLLSVNEG